MTKVQFAEPRVFYIEGQKELGECTLKKEDFPESFLYERIVTFLCGCQMYAGDIDIAERNSMEPIDRKTEFACEIVCSGCNTKIYSTYQTLAMTENLGWVYVVGV